MNIVIAILCAAITGTFFLSACGSDKENSGSSKNNKITSSSVSAESEKAESTVSVEKEDTDSSYSDSDTTKITLNGDSVKIEGDGAQADGGKITVSKAGSYFLSGKLNDGQVIINAGKDDTVKLILNNAEITSSSSSAIYASKCGKTIIVLNENTTNTISDTKTTSGDSQDDDSPNAAVYIQDDLTILGEGTLNVNGNAHNGITTKDTLIITGGKILILYRNIILQIHMIMKKLQT